MIGSTATIPPQSELGQKRYSLVKWLENSQFDSQNEWLGRLTSVPHTNIIDFDADELKAGIEINVIRNNGEIWRAQIIIPKTASNTIDLPPSSYKKIRTKAMGTTGGKLVDISDHMEIANSQANSSQDEYENDKEISDQSQLIILTNAASSVRNHTDNIKQDTESLDNPNSDTLPNRNTSIQLSSEHDDKNMINHHTNESKITHDLQSEADKTQMQDQNIDDMKNQSKNAKPSGAYSSNSNQKEWQFLQTAINEAGLTDFYQTYNDLANTSCNVVATNNNNITSLGNAKLTDGQHQVTSLSCGSNSTPIANQNVVTVSDLNIETILQMQCELLEQQKELKTIELETMEHLRQLHQNINKLSSKFECFELSLNGQLNNTQLVQSSLNISPNNFNQFNNNMNNESSENCHMTSNEHQNFNNLKAAKNVFNKINSTIGQQLKLVDNEILKELCHIPNNNNNNTTLPQTTTVSLLSPTTLLQNTSNQNQASLSGAINNNISNFNSNQINHSNNIVKNQINDQAMNSYKPTNNSLVLANPCQTINSLTAVGKASKQQSNQSQCLATPVALNTNTTKVNVYETNNKSLSQNSNSNSKTVVDMNQSNSSIIEASSNHINGNNSISTKAQGIQTQISLNRFLRESVKQKMGCDFLINNAVSDIPISVMRSIKKEAFEKYLPHDRRPIKAWGLAMASLRCLKRDLVKNKNKQIAANACRLNSMPSAVK